ncbi:MAG: YihY/virulence factor BrkB family protein [Myxococcales bacterium]|nr:YihY/virulence factor BrkB family protein [Myxococcales bacterium]
MGMLREVGRSLEEHDAVRAANAIAFDVFLSSAPLAAFTGWAMHKLWRSNAAVLGPMLEMAPRPLANLADVELMRLSEAGASVVPPLSLLAFLYLSTEGAATAMKIFERIFGAEPRSWLARRFVALVFVIGGVLLLAGSGLVLLLAAWLGGAAGNILGIGISLSTLWFLIAVFFLYATRRRTGQTRRGFRAALVTLGLWIAISASFTTYVRDVANYSRFYGSLATIAMVLVWIWLMCIALIVGAEVNARIEGVRTTPAPPP